MIATNTVGNKVCKMFNTVYDDLENNTIIAKCGVMSKVE